MWDHDYITEGQRVSLWKKIGLALAVWAVIGIIAYALWSAV